MCLSLNSTITIKRADKDIYVMKDLMFSHRRELWQTPFRECLVSFDSCEKAHLSSGTKHGLFKKQTSIFSGIYSCGSQFSDFEIVVSRKHIVLKIEDKKPVRYKNINPGEEINIDFFRFFGSSSVEYYNNVSKGIHSYRPLHDRFSPYAYDATHFVAYIPKGAYYIQNWNRTEIVSSELVIMKDTREWDGCRWYPSLKELI